MQEIKRFGDFELDTNRKILTRCGVEVEIAPRSMDVLILLAQAGGEVVKRSSLIAIVWHGNDVSENAINFAIHKLRQSLKPDGSDLVETVPGQGYRLRLNKAPLPSQLEPAQTPVLAINPALIPPIAPAPPEPGRSNRTRAPASWMLGAIGLFAAGFAGIVSIPSEPFIKTYRALTSDGNPKFGPLLIASDRIYFLEGVNNGNEFVQQLASVSLKGDPDLRIEALPGQSPCLIGFASDDELLLRLEHKSVFAPYYRWSIRHRRLSPENMTGTCNAAVSPDRQRIIDARPSGVFILRLRSDHPEHVVPIQNPRGPIWSPDGKRFRFLLSDFKAQKSSVYECSSDGSGCRIVLDSLSPTIADEFAWSHDLFVFRQHVAGERNDLKVQSSRNPIGSHAISPLTQGLLDYGAHEFSPDSSSLFAIARRSRGEVIRFDPNTGIATPFLRGIFALEVNFSPDGNWVAYQLAPDHTLWKSRMDGSGAMQLTPSGLEVFQPHWSPDVKQIAFMGHKKGGPYRIWTVRPDGSALKEIRPQDPFDQGVPSWSADGTQIVFGELQQRKPATEMLIYVIDLRTNRESILPGSKGKWTPRWSPDGRYIVAQTPDFRSLYLYDVQRQSWRPMIEGLHLIDDPVWSSDSRYVYFRHAKDDITQERIYVRMTPDSTKPEVVTLEHSLPPPYDNEFTVAPDHALIYARAIKFEELYALDLGWR